MGLGRRVPATIISIIIAFFVKETTCFTSEDVSNDIKFIKVCNLSSPISPCKFVSLINDSIDENFHRIVRFNERCPNYKKIRKPRIQGFQMLPALSIDEVRLDGRGRRVFDTRYQRKFTTERYTTIYVGVYLVFLHCC